MTIRRGKVAWTATAALALGLIAPQLSTTAASASSSGSGSGSGATREFGPGIPGDGAGSGGTTHRSKAVHGGRHTSPTTALVVDGAAPGPAQSFDGINFYQQRYVADHGNQFSVEPPDQGLSVGPSSVLESVNDTISTYSKTGAVLSGPTSLNKFYGYASAINRKTGKVGPFVTDPVSYFDADTQRFYHVVLTLDVDGSGNFTGQNHLDLAVSRTSAPTTAYADWLHYSFDVTKDGNSSDGINLGDYPHIGADANGFYITTNSYSFFGTTFGSAELYAFSKKQLATRPTTARSRRYASWVRPPRASPASAWPPPPARLCSTTARPAVRNTSCHRRQPPKPATTRASTSASTPGRSSTPPR